MAKGIIGRKLGMTRLFVQEGVAMVVTVVQAGPCTVVQKKTLEKDGYEAVQLGFGRKKKANRPLTGHCRAAGGIGFAVLREFKIDELDGLEIGSQVTGDIFKVGEKITVTGTSKGRGFAGVIKRHSFAGGRATHGCTTHRSPGSIGSSADPSRTYPGKRMPGHMGDRKTTVRNIEIMDVRSDLGIVLLKGAVPGPAQSLVFLRKK
ncbi:MAG: 50S ribosomal protein L3 [Thermodesulfobacteriota bacterium]